MKSYAIIGLGYVGLGLAIALSKKHPVYGYDINANRVEELTRHIDKNNQVSSDELASSSIQFTQHIEDICVVNLYIVTVSTPAYFYETPNLKPLISAVKKLATIIKQDDTIIFESTVYPGTTDEICIPLLENISGLKSGRDFYVGYSPERINPGDKHHHLENITKIISGQNKKALKNIEETYASICNTVHPVSSIQVAEAIKILENTQRDINIALMNEFAQIMHALKIDMHEVLEGAKTKWSFLPFKPGFVGGHCISIDPLYMAFKAKRVGIYPDLILTARKINDGMTQFIMQSMIRLLLDKKVNLTKVSIGILGITYKENINDIRNSLSLKLVKELTAYGFKCHIHDPMDHHLSHLKPNVKLESINDFKNLSVVILVVEHDYYKNIGLEKILSTCKKPTIFMDIPNLFIKEALAIDDLTYWNL